MGRKSRNGRMYLSYKNTLIDLDRQYNSSSLRAFMNHHFIKHFYVHLNLFVDSNNSIKV